MRFEFEVMEEENKLKGEVIYVKKENSFDYFPMISADITILVNYLNVQISSCDMQIKYIWGLSPMCAWTDRKLVKPQTLEGRIKLKKEFDGGFTFRLNCKGRWKEYFDCNTGWYCIGNPNYRKGQVYVEFANNSIVAICNGIIDAIWLHPKFV